jgi:hypothetical protein
MGSATSSFTTAYEVDSAADGKEAFKKSADRAGIT